MRAKRHIAPSYEASLGEAIAYALANNGHTDEFEVDGIYFTFDIDSRVEDTETVYTGVSFMGDCESYVKTTYKVRVRYNGAYKLHDADTEDVDVALDMDLLAKCIEDEKYDCSEFVVSLS